MTSSGVRFNFHSIVRGRPLWRVHGREAPELASVWEYYFEPEILRTRGDILCAIGDLAAAEEDYEAAISIARSHKARLFELRATMGLCRVWQKQNRAADAVSALGPVYEWFTQGLDTIDLCDARALLDELSPRV